MLRDERIIALDDVVVALKDAADAYEDASGIVAGSDLEELFIELSGRRQKIAATLADHIRALGDLPSEPDADREALGNVVRHVKSMLSDDEWRGLIAEREEDERELSRRVEAALRETLPEPVLETLRECRSEVSSALDRLSAARQAR